MSSLLKVLLVAAVAGGLGFFAGRSTASPSSDSEALRQTLREQSARLDAMNARLITLGPGSCATAQTLDPATLRAEVARAIREALPAGPGEKAAPAKEEPKHDEPSPDSVAATEAATRLIASATSSRQWTDAEAEQFRQLLPKMNDEQRMEALRKLTATLNRGEIKVLTHGPAF